MSDQTFMDAAIALALQAEQAGNLPVGAVLVLDGAVIAEGRNALLQPHYHPGRHAETEALKAVDPALWPRARHMTCYTTLEPCLMCFGALLLHGVGQIVFGATDPDGGFTWSYDHLPPYYPRQAPAPRWEGPICPERCDALYQRTLARFLDTPAGGQG
ncbi:MAG: nucleoside deaminase [Candidatus Sericytochromatia bacterium]|nr:nucleoside deaminase [Candidatus Sericytochromatia bacterium]